MIRIMLLVLIMVVLPLTARAEGPDFERLFTGLDVPLLLIEPESGRIIDANPVAANFYGYSLEKMQRMTIQQINVLTPEEVAAERQRAQSQGRNHFIFRHRLADGQIRSVEVYSRPFNFDGRLLLLSLVHDITPDRQNQADLWHYQERLEATVDAQTAEISRNRRLLVWLLGLAVILQSVAILALLINRRQRRRLEAEREILLTELQGRNHDLSSLGTAMAHHFQEPARRLVSFSQRLRGKLAVSSDQDAQISLDFIDSQARRLSDLVHDVQRYLALDHADFHDADSDTVACLRQALTQGESWPADRVIDVPPDLPRLAVPHRPLVDLFALLLDNARRYRRLDQPLRIALTVKIAQGRAWFQLKDNGKGIEPGYREQVFTMFSRLVPNDVPGTGIGLALARKIVHIAGGSIYIEDGIDGGVAVVFDLPLAKSVRENR